MKTAISLRMKTAIVSWLLSGPLALTALAADIPEANLPTAGGMNSSDFFRVLTNGHSAKISPALVSSLLAVPTTNGFVSLTQLQGSTNTATLNAQGVGTTAAQNATNDLSGVLKAYADSKTNAVGIIQIITNSNPLAVSITGSASSATTATYVLQNAFTNITIYGDASRTNAVYISGVGETLSNALGSVTLAGGNVTASGTFSGSGNGLSNVVRCIQTISDSMNTAFGSGVSAFYPPVGSASVSTTESTVSVPFVSGGILTNLFVKTTVGADTNFSFFVMTNGARSGLSVTWNGTGSALSVSNTSVGVLIPANATISCCATGNNATPASNPRIFWTFEKLNQ